jgi:dTDP-glucose pyrophosphorylase/predicted transcriptional regulator
MKDLSKILVSPDTPILQVIRIIDDSSMQIALVVEEGNRLAGTVTDGDIRRGILKGVSLDNPVRQVMNSEPTVARLNEGREHILSLMRSRQFRHIPVLDENGRVARIEILEDLIRAPDCENWVVLMAGGAGSRLGGLTSDCPKPLLKVGKKPILETILENFIEYGFRRFFISVNYMADMVENHFGDGSRWNVEISYLREEMKLGTAGPLALLPERPSKPLLVMNGDLLTTVNFRQLLDFHMERRAVATMCVREYHFQVPYGVVGIEKNRLVRLDEKPVHRFFVNAGIYVLDPSTLDHVPRDTYFDMPVLFEKLLAMKLEVAPFPIREYWLDIGRLDDLERAKGEYPEVFK